MGWWQLGGGAETSSRSGLGLKRYFRSDESRTANQARYGRLAVRRSNFDRFVGFEGGKKKESKNVRSRVTMP